MCAKCSVQQPGALPSRHCYSPKRLNYSLNVSVPFIFAGDEMILGQGGCWESLSCRKKALSWAWRGGGWGGFSPCFCREPTSHKDRSGPLLSGLEYDEPRGPEFSLFLQHR